ncbi:ribonuclease H-like domain-containing protein, partial [bacterium]|nr:ribonuclease H-like domain-containing protein [bacterium]
MLESTFCHLPGIGPARETKLWSAGLDTWDALAGGSGRHAGISACARAHLAPLLERSRAERASGNPSYFASLLPHDATWRLFRDFRAGTAYLDIETTGMAGGIDVITSISLYDGADVKSYVYGRNLDEFLDDVARYRVLVTYNGACFDVPFIERYFNVRLPHAQIDLRYVLRSLGYTGGLKACEKRLGIDRQGLDGVDGYFAVLLWNEYARRGNGKALDTLLAYNQLDTVNLEA